MKQNTDSRLLKAIEVTKDQLINKIKSSDTTRFDQMLIETEERKNYFFVKYNSVAYTRKPKTLKFPLFKDLVNDFEKNIEKTGEIKILEDDRIIQKIIAKGKEPIDTPKYLGKNLIFSELKISTENDKVKIKQPVYYIPSETERCTCNTCKGDMYTTCTETECRGKHIYDCSKCRTSGKLDCDDCNARGEYSCPSCKGKGTLTCSGCSGKGRSHCKRCTGSGYTSDGKRCPNRCDRGWTECRDCKGSGERKCSSVNTSGGLVGLGVGNLVSAGIKKTAGNEYCGGSGIIRCETCSATGKITCDKCEGDGKIECKTCHGDHVDNRYGKVDCRTCETAGELASFSYIETEIKADNLELIFTDGKKIDAPNFGADTIKKYTNTNGQLALTYKNLNGENKDAYDDYSTFCSKNALSQIGASKEKYPKLITEEMYYESVPCSTFNYNHILSATFHDVSVLSIDKEQDVLFHSNPTAVAEEKENVKEKLNELCRRAFSTKAFKDKIDRKHEMFLMVHMAKADGVIEEQEKKYLAQTITGLHGFTNKEKAELFGLMSSNTLPSISPLNAYFSSKERAEEARQKIVELVAKADGDYEPEEKAKLEEINKAIEDGFKAKPSGVGQFFKTWQVSVSIFALLAILGTGVYFFGFVYPQMRAEKKAQKELKAANQQRIMDSTINTLQVDENQSNVSTEISKSESKTETPVSQTNDESSVMIGKWTGDMGGKQITIVIEKISGNELFGYNSVGDNKRDIKGTFIVSSWDQACSKAFEATLNEPGDDKWDGVFTIKFVGYEDQEEGTDGIECKGNLKGQEAMGDWKANNGKSTKELTLTKK